MDLVAVDRPGLGAIVSIFFDRFGPERRYGKVRPMGSTPPEQASMPLDASRVQALFFEVASVTRAIRMNLNPEPLTGE
jgi:hypothetical protein